MQTKVVKILSETEVVLGTGSENGMHEGMEFVIYEDGDIIIDPETKESLGALEIVKGYVTVVNVQPKLSIAKTHTHSVTRTRTVHGSSLLSVLSGSIREEQIEVEKVDKLRVENPDPSYEKRLIVRIGDKARLTRG
jgi:hypothetical protein